jgi:hypothetical protein
MKADKVKVLAEKVVEHLENTGYSLIGIVVSGYPLKGWGGESEISYRAWCDLLGNYFYTGTERIKTENLKNSIKSKGERAVRLIEKLSGESENIYPEPEISGDMKEDMYVINILKEKESTEYELRTEFLSR